MQPAPFRLGLIGIVNDAMKQDFWATARRVAELGYQGIENAGPLLQGDPAANIARLRGLGLELLTTAASRETLRDDVDSVLRQAEALGVRRVSCWWAPTPSRDQWLADAEAFEAAGARLAREGIRLAYHHHDHEFTTSFDGVRAFDLLAANTDPKHVGFVVDLAWAEIGGEQPDTLIRRLGARVTSLHVKDVAVAARGEDRSVPWVALGAGVVRIRAALEAAAEVGVTWAVVEQDKLHRLDAWDTLRLSRLHLAELGFVPYEASADAG